MIPDVIDNRPGRRLSDILNNLITPQTKVYIATAYFNLSGFNLIKDKLKQAQEVKILLGRGLTSDKALSPEIIFEQLRQEAEGKMSDIQMKAGIEDFLQWLKKPSVQIKIYKKNFYHGKLYIIEGIDIIGSIAISGSSNFTEAALAYNRELNTVQKQQSVVNELKKTFEELWDESEDYTQELNNLYSRFTCLYTPYEIYLKVLYSYFQDKLGDISTPDKQYEEPVILADFQRDGYLAALQGINKYNGVMLCDSVGLGKTYLAIKILDDFAYKLRQRAVVICPAQLKDILWKRLLDRAAIKAEIVSREKVSRDFNIQEYSNYDLIVVDESHNFRNINTNCWKNLFSTIIQGKPKKVVLITATPVNNSIFDLYNQLRLITKDNDEFFKTSGISSLRGYFIRAERDKETLYDLLEEIAVRRSRQFIKKYYPNATIDGEPVKFPERKLETVCYSLEDTYKGIYKECADAIENLTIASYNVEAYRKEIKELRFNYEKIKETLLIKGWKEENVHEFLMKLGRNESVIAILKILLLKRFESSIKAFKISIQNLINFQEKFLEVFNKGRILDRETYQKSLLQHEADELEEEQKEQIYEFQLEQLPQIKMDEYEVEEIRKAVENDIKTLQYIYSRVAKIKARQDAKLQVLMETLKKLEGKKIIIFAYFKNTIRYLYRHLGGNEKWLKTKASPQERKDAEGFLKEIGITSGKISIIDSVIKPKERKDRIIRFSPISNERPEIKGSEKEIQILLSTDVLSEGQNLQDADTVINYDLPWNPVKLIQRVGRIDRLKSPHKYVCIYNFFPENALESMLGILKRLQEKIDAIDRSIGLDASILGEKPNPKDFGYIRDIFEEKESVLDELESISELAIGEFLKEELLKYIKEAGEEKIKNIPDGVGSCLKREGCNGLFVAFKGKEHHYWCYYDLRTDKIIENKLQAIRFIKCNRDEPPAEFNFDPYEIIAKVKDHILNRAKTQHFLPVRLKSPQNDVVNRLQAIGDEAKDLIDYFSASLPEIYLKDLRRLWKQSSSLNKRELLDVLRDFINTHPLVEGGKKTESDGQEPEELRLIAYCGVV